MIIDQRIAENVRLFLDEEYPTYHLRVVSSFRSYDSQVQIFERRQKEAKSRKLFLDPAAPPGHSYHEAGLAIDLGPRDVIQNRLTFNQWNNLLNMAERYGLLYQLGDWPGEGSKKFDWVHFYVRPSAFGISLEENFRTFRNIGTDSLQSLKSCAHSSEQ